LRTNLCSTADQPLDHFAQSIEGLEQKPEKCLKEVDRVGGNPYIFSPLQDTGP